MFRLFILFEVSELPRSCRAFWFTRLVGFMQWRLTHMPPCDGFSGPDGSTAVPHRAQLQALLSPNQVLRHPISQMSVDLFSDFIRHQFMATTRVPSPFRLGSLRARPAIGLDFCVLPPIQRHSPRPA